MVLQLLLLEVLSTTLDPSLPTMIRTTHQTYSGRK